MPVSYTHLDVYKRQAGGCPLSVADAAEGADLSSLVLKGVHPMDRERLKNIPVMYLYATSDGYMWLSYSPLSKTI